MTESEAIKSLKEMFPKGLCEKDEYEMAQKAINALEKKIAKKPTYDGNGYAPDGSFAWDEWLCPNCGSRYEVDFDEYDYCPNCGQKLDWSEEE